MNATIPLLTVNEILRRCSSGHLFVISVCVVAFVASLDYLSSDNIAVSLLYLVPVWLAARTIGRDASIAISVLSWSCWVANGYTHENVHGSLTVVLVGLVARLGGLVGLGILMSPAPSGAQSRSSQASTVRTDIIIDAVLRERLSHDMEMARRNRTPLSVACISMADDQGRSEKLLTNYGRPSAESAVRRVRRILRESDTISVIGKHEVVLILPNTGTDAALIEIQRLKNELMQTPSHRPDAPRQLATGLVTIEEVPSKAEAALNPARYAMHGARRRGIDVNVSHLVN
jgi:GGDEF domain-containing protein